MDPNSIRHSDLTEASSAMSAIRRQRLPKSSEDIDSPCLHFTQNPPIDGGNEITRRPVEDAKAVDEQRLGIGIEGHERQGLSTELVEDLRRLQGAKHALTKRVSQLVPTSHDARPLTLQRFDDAEWPMSDDPIVSPPLMMIGVCPPCLIFPCAAVKLPSAMYDPNRSGLRSRNSRNFFRAESRLPITERLHRRQGFDRGANPSS